ncbi:outer membrane channel protein TolC [Enterovibrio norvegicus]|uniref:Outer membrane protein n=2 Tax=Enterovibrio norvegicus TaxID=188144 RepID=A0A1I5T871_9GAMM|nr:outer membrane channel protein TolC [Enterovibrio norvegicus]MCC4800522.1 outer membrane channel protein TolC [Enterovibrio norvegicus]OEE51435.1 outer membrane channel protein TolC [Enterovibrio norvegicus]OEF54664.1 outer membrane channel protein TolC [Enterovibrio norvegicus]OEF59737.1 outer membrane channel protein TolC [Enterovibrio norvegicus]PMH64884.1 outer membrane channel protein TolC [Enterovibrio norvegicus]
MKKLLPLFIGVALGTVAPLASADDLIQVYEQAKQSDPQLLQAAATKDAAFAAVDTNRGTLLPQINLSAGYNLSRNSEDTFVNDTNTLTAGIDFSQELFDQNSWINLDLAEITARQADATYAASQQSLILRVSTAYFDVLRAIDDLVFVRAEKAAVGRQLEQTKQRFEVGLSAITDVHDAQAQYDSVLAQEIQAKNVVTNSYEELREITGQSHADLSVLNTRTFSASSPEQTQDALVKQAEETNLSLLAQRITRDASKERISLAESGHMPSLTLDLGYGYTDRANETDSSGDFSNNQLTGGINFNMPLYTGGRTTAQVKEAQFNYVAASEALEARYRSTVKDVRAFYNNINASIGSLRAFEQTVVSARSALEATEAGFEVGTRTIVDVLDSTRRLYDANRSLSDARYDYILSVLQLRQAVGTLNEEDLVEINQGLVPPKK